MYAYWHFDDFSWGETRRIEGEVKGSSGHGDKEGVFDSRNIVMKVRLEIVWLYRPGADASRSLDAALGRVRTGATMEAGRNQSSGVVLRPGHPSDSSARGTFTLLWSHLTSLSDLVTHLTVPRFHTHLCRVPSLRKSRPFGRPPPFFPIPFPSAQGSLSLLSLFLSRHCFNPHSDISPLLRCSLCFPRDLLTHPPLPVQMHVVILPLPVHCLD